MIFYVEKYVKSRVDARALLGRIGRLLHRTTLHKKIIFMIPVLKRVAKNFSSHYISFQFHQMFSFQLFLNKTDILIKKYRFF